MVGGTRCLDAEQMRVLRTGAANSKDMARLDAHLAECGRCRAWVLQALCQTVASGSPSSESPGDAPLAPNWQLEPGVILAQKYRIDETLGAGTTGATLMATHLELGHRVAIKVLRSRQPGAAARILRELKICGKLTTVHVARLVDVVHPPDGSVLVVTELLNGEDLTRLIAHAVVAPSDAARYVSDACTALREVHAAGSAHRNLKPSNLFLAQRTGAPPILKLLDLGISSAMDGEGGEAGAQTAESGALPRSLYYRSPEQIQRQKDVDWRTDLWSLGVALYELLTGQRPFCGDTLAALTASILRDAPVPPSSVRAGVPGAFDAIVLRCLEKQPLSRFESARELAEALAPLAEAPFQSPLSPALPPPARPVQTSPKARRRGVLLAVATVATSFGLYAWRKPSLSTAIMPSRAANAGCEPPSLIDDLERERPTRRCERVVTWSVANDGTGTQWPAMGVRALRSLIPNGGRGVSKYAIHTYGSGFTSWGANVSAGLNAASLTTPYDAEKRGYSALRFYARLGDDASAGKSGPYADGALVRVSDRLSAAPAGVCSEDPGPGRERCYDDPGLRVKLTTEWHLIVVPFSAMRTAGWGYGGVRSLDTRALYAISFAIPARERFDLWIDDVYFQ